MRKNFPAVHSSKLIRYFLVEHILSDIINYNFLANVQCTTKKEKLQEEKNLIIFRLLVLPKNSMDIDESNWPSKQFLHIWKLFSIKIWNNFFSPSFFLVNDLLAIKNRFDMPKATGNLLIQMVTLKCFSFELISCLLDRKFWSWKSLSGLMIAWRQKISFWNWILLSPDRNGLKFSDF